MPSWPTGVQTSTLVFGRGVTIGGNQTSATLNVTPIYQGTNAVVWEGDGTPMLGFSESAAAIDGAYGSVPIPVVDQDGWIDSGGNAYKFWGYQLVETPKYGSLLGQSRTKMWQPLTGQTTVDFDLIPDGALGLPMSGPQAVVTSVNGETGAVIISGGGGGGGGAAIADGTTATTSVWSSSKVSTLLAGKATPADVTAAVNAVIASAPGALDTLDELAAALGDDANFAATITGLIAAKATPAQVTAAVDALAASVAATYATQTALTSGLAGKQAAGDYATTAVVTTGDAAAKARANHTGTQPSTTISDFTEAVQDAVASLLGAGSNVVLNYDDTANTLTVSATGSGGSGLDAEAVRDAIGVALVGVGNIVVTVNDAADTITISTTATANSTDAALRDRASHTGTQDPSSVVGLPTALAERPTAAEVAATYAAIPDGLAVGAITRSGTGAATSFGVVWPDGATGTFTGTESTTTPGAIDTYTITHVKDGTTITYTQPTLTRNASGAVTNRPAITAA